MLCRLSQSIAFIQEVGKSSEKLKDVPVYGETFFRGVITWVLTRAASRCDERHVSCLLFIGSKPVTLNCSSIGL